MRFTFPTLVALVATVSAGAVQSINATPVPTSAVRTVDVRVGRVTNEAGEPIADARVQLYRAGSSDLISMVRTEKDGSYKVSLPASGGAYTLRILSIGYQPVVMSLTAAGTPTVVTMRPVAQDGPAL